MNEKLKTLSKSILRVAGRTVRDAAISIVMDAINRRRTNVNIDNLDSDYYKAKLSQAAINTVATEIEQSQKDVFSIESTRQGVDTLRGKTKNVIAIDDAGFLADKPIDLWDDPDALMNQPTLTKIVSAENLVPAVDIPKLCENVSAAIEQAPADTTDVEVAIPHIKPNPNFVPRTKEQLWDDAQAAVANMDSSEGLADLDGSIGRIAVDEKRMINCRADLNQLIPFKYGFAWQAYLKSTERHWTFQEVRLDEDIKDWSESTLAESKVIVSATYSLELNSVFLNNDAVLNIYRFITNPEARQYLLRQRAELSVWGNFVHSVMDTYNEQLAPTDSGVERFSFNDKTYRSFFMQAQVSNRQANRRDIQLIVSDPSIMQQSSDDINDRWSVVKCLVLQYLVFGLVYNYTSLIQLLALRKRGKYLGLTQGACNILRDLAMHTEFSVLCINQIFEENADLLTEDNIQSLRKAVNYHVIVEIEYMDWWANLDLPDCKIADQIKTLQFMVDRYLSSISFQPLFNQPNANVDWFVKLYDSFLPDLNSGGDTVLSASGTGGSLDWSD